MRQTLIGILLFVFGPLAALVLGRLMSSAPEWIWRVVQCGCIVAGAIIACLSDPIYSRLWGEKYTPSISTLIVAIATALTAAGIWLSLVVPIRKTATLLEQPKTEGERPHVATSLVIDSVSGQSVDFHIQVENIGQVSIHNIRVSYSTKGFRAVEVEPIPRMLPPRGRLSITGKPRVLERGEYRSVVVNIRYDTVTKKDLISSNIFGVTPARLRPGSIIDPESLLEPEMSVSDEQQLEEIDIPAGFSTPVGTIKMSLNEYYSGTPNRYHMRDKEGTKYFEFDPVGRTVLFTVATVSGRRVRLEQPLKPDTIGRYHVVIVWDLSKGAKLSVDGVLISDFK